MKAVIVTIILVVVGVGVVNAIQSQSATKVKNVSSSPVSIFSLLTPTPSPIIPIALRQQCSDDADRLFTRLSQENDRSKKSAQETGHMNNETVRLKQSIYSVKLDTCVAEVDLYGSYDGTFGSIETVYDTITGKILAELFYPDNKTSYIDGKHGTINSVDYLDYKISIGL